MGIPTPSISHDYLWFKADFKIFIKNNANSGLISSLEEVRSFSADMGDRIENIEDALEELNQDLNKESE